MFSWKEIKDIWSNYDYEIVISICLILLLLYGIYNKFVNKQGTWTDTVIVPSKQKERQQSPQFRRFDSRGELECRRVLQKLFRRPFNKIRPNFLSNVVTGGMHNLEIDCYDHDLRLGVEYQGKQHYEFTPYFHKSREAFYNQKYRDELKRHLCKDNRITLIEVPYNIKIEDIENYLIMKLKKHGFI